MQRVNGKIQDFYTATAVIDSGEQFQRAAGRQSAPTDIRHRQRRELAATARREMRGEGIDDLLKSDRFEPLFVGSDNFTKVWLAKQPGQATAGGGALGRRDRAGGTPTTAGTLADDALPSHRIGPVPDGERRVRLRPRPAAGRQDQERAAVPDRAGTDAAHDARPQLRMQLPGVPILFGIMIGYALLTYVAIVLVIDYPRYDALFRRASC